MSHTEFKPLDPHTFGDQPCFGCSPTHPIGFRLQFALEGELVTTRFTPRPDMQGPPGIMHGGLVLALADEVAAWTIVGHKNRLGFTARADAKLRAPVRIGVEVYGKGRLIADKGRVIEVGVELEQKKAIVFSGQFKFALLDKAGTERVLGASLPEAWERFCR